MRPGPCSRFAPAALILALGLAFPIAAPAVSVTVGRQDLTPPASFSGAECSTSCTYSPRSLASGSAYAAIPGDGAITSWRVRGGVVGGTIGSLSLRVLRPSGSDVIGAGASPSLAAISATGQVVHLVSPLPVQAGDRIGVAALNLGASISIYIRTAVSEGPVFDVFGAVGEGKSAPLLNAADGELLFNADVDLAPPVVSGLSPASGPETGGQAVTISGDHLTGASAVSFGDKAATSVSVISNTRVAVVTPASVSGDVNVTVTTPAGRSAASARYRFEPRDRTRPVLSAFTLTPRSFVAANAGPAVAAATTRVGTRAIYRLSEPARTRLVIERAGRGVRRGGRCAKGRVKAGGHRCTRYVPLKGALQHEGAQGLNTFRFMGRLGGRTLRPGRYRLTATAEDQARNTSKPRRQPFRVVD
jgi:hypothetical protein